MSDYTKATNFAVKDGLPSGNPAKLIKGTEIDTEFTAIQTAVATKADKISPNLSGTITLAAGTTISTNSVSVSDVELGYVDGVTSNIQNQLNGKASLGNVPVDTHAATSKATPVDADEIPLIDSAASFGLKNLTWANLKSTLKTYFDTLYLALSGGSMTGGLNYGRSTVASAATTADIWAAKNQIDWTGTTTCTGFPAAPQAGASRRLICAAAAPFTAGANMLIDGTPSGTTVTLEANDIVDVEAITTTQFRLVITKYTGRGVGNGSKAGTTTRDLTSASGNQTITGCPFRPTRVFIQASIDGSRQNSDGWSDGTTNTCYKIDYTSTVDGLSTSTCVFIRTAVGDYQTATISFTNDGFTIAWTKVGSPTGTASIAYMMEA